MARALSLSNHPEAISVDSSNNVTVEGNFDVNGTQTIIDSTTVAVTDSLFKLAKDNTTADTLDAGWYGVYNDGSTRYAGIARDATDGKFIVYDGLTEEPGTTIDTGHASFNKATLNAGELQDAQGNVRALDVTTVNSTPYTIVSGSSGKYFALGSGSGVVTINNSNFAVGDIVTIYNRLQAATATLNFSGFTLAHIAGSATNKSSMTLSEVGICTLIYDRSGVIVVNGNVS